ncbi:hypothetical protein K440DRAFT_623260, partial [Wilcoxina mikolae CBS 423.85]
MHTTTHPNNPPMSTLTPALFCNPNRSPFAAAVVVLLATIDSLGLGFGEPAGVVEESGTGKTRYTVLVGGDAGVVLLDIIVLEVAGAVDLALVGLPPVMSVYILVVSPPPT